MLAGHDQIQKGVNRSPSTIYFYHKTHFPCLNICLNGQYLCVVSSPFIAGQLAVWIQPDERGRCGQGERETDRQTDRQTDRGRVNMLCLMMELKWSEISSTHISLCGRLTINYFRHGSGLFQRWTLRQCQRLGLHNIYSQK